MKQNGFPENHGLYDPQFEHDSCGVGFVCNINGEKSHQIVKEGVNVLNRLSHRGAVGADPKTGDGAGILIQVPHKFLLGKCSEAGISLPPPGLYGTGLVFFPQERKERDFCVKIFEKTIKEENARFIGWRDVPFDDSLIGITARQTEPIIRQVFIEKSGEDRDQLGFERQLYVIRKKIEGAIRGSKIKQRPFFYITNLSSRTLSYKGLFMPDQLDGYFLDLKDKDVESAICLVHSRYSTNTFPTWDLAQPFRFLAHNGEINTLRGNINWMKARESLLGSRLFGKDIEKLKPVIAPGGSDSAAIDNVFELLVLAGQSLPEVMMTLIPEAWEQNKTLDKRIKDFYQYNACLMEPWDGPAAIAFTDGETVGAILDRNGLRPARFVITKSGLVIMASEVGVSDIKPEDIKKSGRLEPGKIFFIDTKKKRIIDDEEIKKKLSTGCPYGAWLKDYMVEMDKISAPGYKAKINGNVLTHLKVFGYTREDLKFIIKPMAENGIEPTGSMGNDTPHAVLSKRPQILYNYFKQLFAQVTNPAIDPIREELVMSLYSYVGPQWNILEKTSRHCHKLLVKEPILGDEELEKIRKISLNGFKAKTISILFDPANGAKFISTLDDICREAKSAISDGYSFIILSDRGVDKKHAAIPALMATGAVHHYLVKHSLRTRVGIMVESAEPREVHHFALLFGYGADCINPYLTYECIRHMMDEGDLNINSKIAVKNYRKAVRKGILKILSKMGISTLRSYRGAQIFEALGLNKEITDKCFAGTTSRIGGAGFEVIAEEVIARHREAYPESTGLHTPYLTTGGVYQWKKDGEYHLWNPDSIAALQDSVRKGDYGKYRKFTQLINDQSDNPTTLRSLLKFVKTKPVPLGAVEPASEIVRRFVTGAMSFGSISKAAHETLAIAMNRLKAKSNTGEGGEDPSRFMPLENGDSMRSAIKQVASGRFGVTTNYLINADEIQIKIAQGAKPGEGGQLPGHKVSEIIARTRYTTPGVTLISPPPHHDIYSIEDLAQLIFDLKNVNPKARISVKLVSETGVGTVAAGVAKGRADMILISGGDGGTGASPRSSIMHAGLPWELGLSETHQTLVLNNLRSRVRLQTDGQMRTGRDVAIAALLGAEEYGFCTAALIVMGCVMLRHCHLNNCSAGVATQDELLQKNFRGKVDDVITYFNFVTEELREIMAGLGIRRINDMIGRVELLELNKSIIPWKAKKIDYGRILYKPPFSGDAATRCWIKQDHKIENVLDVKLIGLAKEALEKGKPVKMDITVNNRDRSVGAMLSGKVCGRYGEEGLDDDTIHCRFKGIAGQSFGAFLAKGITFELEGMANDYVGKGISGGKIIIYPYKNSDYKADENIIMGNTSFYGAINGEAYISGVAGERFCIRNSGLYAVVEGAGDHGCEYMTGGIVVVLGKTGKNFGAGMSGGVAYVYDEDNCFKERYNSAMVLLEKPSAGDRNAVLHLVRSQYRYTGSIKAKKILDNADREFKKFIKVMPIEYRRLLEDIKAGRELELSEVLDG